MSSSEERDTFNLLMVATEKKQSSKKLPAPRASAVACTNAAKQVRKATDATWALAPKCPMFTRKGDPKKKYKRFNKKTGEEEEYKVVRTNRLISSHAYKVAASGAAQAAVAFLSREADKLRLKVDKESPKAPFLPGFSVGAKALLEQFLCAYAAEGFANAIAIKDTLKTHKRPTAKMMHLGFQAAHASVFHAACPGGRAIFVSSPDPKPVKKDGKLVKPNDADFVPDANDVADDADEPDEVDENDDE